MQRHPIVFAPGMMCTKDLFAPQIAAQQGERSISVADLTTDTTIEAMASRLLKNAPPRFCLAGLSMGGIVALEVIRRAPDRVAGLALLNTTPFAASPARKQAQLNQMERVRQGHLKEVVLEELKPAYLADAHKRDQALLDIIYGMSDDLGAEVFLRQTEAVMARADSSDTLRGITCPTAVICGEEDDVCPPEMHEIMSQAIRGSRLHILPGCGHLSTLEAAEAVTEILNETFQQADEASAKEEVCT